MNGSWHDNRRRLRDLLADRAVFGLDTAESAELDGLCRVFPDTDVDRMDRIVARCDLALGIATSEPLPAVLRERIRAAACDRLETR